MPLVGIDPATLAPCGQEPYPTYKMARGLDFLHAGALAKLPDAIRKKGYVSFSEPRVGGETDTHFTDSKDTFGREIGCPENVLISDTIQKKGIYFRRLNRV